MQGGSCGGFPRLCHPGARVGAQQMYPREGQACDIPGDEFAEGRPLHHKYMLIHACTCGVAEGVPPKCPQGQCGSGAACVRLVTGTKYGCDARGVHQTPTRYNQKVGEPTAGKKEPLASSFLQGKRCRTTSGSSRKASLQQSTRGSVNRNTSRALVQQ